MSRAMTRGRSRTRRSVSKYAPMVRAGASLVRAGVKAYKKHKSSASKGRDDQQPLYGTTFTSKVAYRAKRPNKRRKRFAKKSFKGFIQNSMKLQNAQNNVSHNFFQITTLAGAQQWGSVDLLNASAIFNMVSGQLPAITTSSNLRDFQLALKTFSLRWYLVNTGTSPVYVDIYHVVPRRDVSYPELGSPSVPTNGNVLAVSFNTGFGSSDTLPDTKADPQMSSNTLGATPFLYSNFCRVFKITKMRTVKMSSGDTYEERDTVLNRMLNLAKLGVVGNAGVGPTNQWYIRGLSKCLLFRVRGMPTAVSEAPVSAVTIGWEEMGTSKVIQTKPGSSAVYTGEA